MESAAPQTPVQALEALQNAYSRFLDALPEARRASLGEAIGFFLRSDGNPKLGSLVDAFAEELPVHVEALKTRLAACPAEEADRLATQALEGIAPCVVVIDELEKIFGGVDRESSSEVGSNLFSQFLQWMEKPQKKRMLIIATANRIDRLPSECKRKGRFDEIFSVNIPNRRECLAIVKVHLKKYEDVLEAAEGGTDAVIDELAEAFMRLAARKRRFVSGADIEGICRFLFTSLFSSYISSLERDPEGLRSAQAGGKPFQYPKAEVLAALETEIGRTRSFFDSNMAETAQYWLQTKELAFRSASEEGDDLFQSAGYLFAEDTYKFYVQSGESGKRQPVCGEPYAKNLEAMAANAAQSGDYDGALRATLAKYIYAQKPKN